MADKRAFPGVHPFQRICKAWLGKIELAKKAKQGWQTIADQCMSFYSGTFDFMWEDAFQKKYFKGKEGRLNPRFHITIQKAFELVAIFGPALYARNPQRQITAREPLEVLPEYFSVVADPMNPMAAQMAFDQAMQLQQQDTVANKVISDLLHRYLNYTPNELPGGGLARQSMMALDEALIKGRGCLWTEPYYYPGSERMIVGSFYDSVDNLLIDPDATLVEHATWIARKCIAPTWQIERDFQLPRGCLDGYGSAESAERESERNAGDMPERDKSIGRSNDLLVYWKVYSRMGVGSRLAGDKGDNEELSAELDDALGDNVYLAVAKDIPFPLNCFSESFLQMDDDQVAECFTWPTPFWKDDRWPVTMLDFYNKPNSVWPLAPLAPALGILIAINILMAHMVSRTWSSTRDFWGVKKAAAEELKKVLLAGEDQSVIEVTQEMGDKIQDVVTVLQQPQANTDAWTIIQQLFSIFERMTGLSELAAGMQTRAMRSAEEAKSVFGQVGVRPDHMGKQVEAFMTEVARREGLTARWFLQATDLDFALGQPAGWLWQQYVLNDDPEKVVREIQYRIEAGSTRKPNKDKEIEVINEAMQYLPPILMQYATTTGDTNPLNAFIRRWAKAQDITLDDMMLGQMLPPMPPPMPGMPGQPGMEGMPPEQGMPMEQGMPPEGMPPELLAQMMGGMQ